MNASAKEDVDVRCVLVGASGSPDHTAVQNAIELIAGKWKLAVLCKVCGGPQRFGELRRTIHGIRHKVLIEQLRALERDGLISRRDLSSDNALHVEYSCTPFGRSVRPILVQLAGWAGRPEESRAGLSGSPPQSGRAREP